MKQRLTKASVKGKSQADEEPTHQNPVQESLSDGALGSLSDALSGNLSDALSGSLSDALSGSLSDATSESHSDVPSRSLSDDGTSDDDIEELRSNVNTPGRAFMLWVEIPCKYPKNTSRMLWVEIPCKNPQNTSDEETSDDVAVWWIPKFKTPGIASDEGTSDDDTDEWKPRANTPRSLVDERRYKPKTPDVFSDEETSDDDGGDDDEWKPMANTSKSLANEETSDDVPVEWRYKLKTPGVVSDGRLSGDDVEDWTPKANISESHVEEGVFNAVEWRSKLKTPGVFSDEETSDGDADEWKPGANTPRSLADEWRYKLKTSGAVSDEEASDNNAEDWTSNFNTSRSLADEQIYRFETPGVVSDEETSDDDGDDDDDEWKPMVNTSRSLADEGTSDDSPVEWRYKLKTPGVVSDEGPSDDDAEDRTSNFNTSRNLADERIYKFETPGGVSDEETSHDDAEDWTSKANIPRNISDEGTFGDDIFRWGSRVKTPRRVSDDETSDDDADEWKFDFNTSGSLAEEWRNRVNTPGIISGEGTSDDPDERNSVDNTSGSLSEITSNDDGADECKSVANSSSSLSDEGASDDDIVKWSPKVNDIFFSIEEAVRQIKAWAISEGFKMTIRKSEPRMKMLKCWCHGEPLQPKLYAVRKTKARSKGCLVQINVNAPLERKGEAYISLFNDVEHTHPLNGDRGLLGSEVDPMAQIKARQRAEKLHHMYIKRRERERLRVATLKEARNLQREARKLQEEATKPKRKPGRPKKKAENEQLLLEAEELFSLLEEHRLKEPGWFVSKTREGLRSEPRRIFWMNPLQRDVYSRYHDIILHGNAARSSKVFRLAMFVAVDNQGKSRVVACALVLGHTDLDHEWVLQQLLEAGRGDDGKVLVPKVILVDGELRMDRALRNVLPDTHVVNCIRHFSDFTLRSNLINILGKSDFKDFMLSFWLAQKSLTAGEFKGKWATFLVKALLKDSQVEHSLRKAYKRRLQWARFQVGLLFTAGLQSTQRVKSISNLIKREISGKTPPLQDLFLSVQGRVRDEDVTKRHIAYKDDLKVNLQRGRSGACFPDVVEINKKYLGRFAREETDKEISNSMSCDICSVKIEEAIGWHLQDIPIPETTSQLGNGNDVEMGGDGNNPAGASDSGANKVDESAQLQDTGKASLALFLIELGLPKIEAVFEVTQVLPPNLKQYVILLKDNSHICTCLLLRNKGIACAHFFRAMRADKRVQYHIRLIPKRWYREDKQDDPNLEEEIRGLPFMISNTHGENTTAVIPGDNYLEDYLSIKPQSRPQSKPQSKSQSKVNNSLNKRKHGGNMGDTSMSTLCKKHRNGKSAQS